MVLNLPPPPIPQDYLTGNRVDLMSFLLNKPILPAPITSLYSQHLQMDQSTGRAGVLPGTEGGLTELGFPVSSRVCILKIDVVFILHLSYGNAKSSQR